MLPFMQLTKLLQKATGYLLPAMHEENAARLLFAAEIQRTL
jgi:hypothetical protein